MGRRMGLCFGKSGSEGDLVMDCAVKSQEVKADWLGLSSGISGGEEGLGVD